MDVFKPNRNLDQISSEFKNKFIHQWILQMFTFSQKNIFHVFVLFQKIAYMYPLTEGVLVWTWPHPSSSSALYFPLKVLACKTSYPLGTSSGLPWARFEYFMEKHISVPTVCCFFKLLNLFLYIVLFHRWFIAQLQLFPWPLPRLLSADSRWSTIVIFVAVLQLCWWSWNRSCLSNHCQKSCMYLDTSFARWNLHESVIWKLKKNWILLIFLIAIWKHKISLLVRSETVEGEDVDLHSCFDVTARLFPDANPPWFLT